MKVSVIITLKKDVLDPQGKVIHQTLDGMGFDMYKYFGLHQFQSADFKPHQLVTHLFMHGNFTHLFFNMFFNQCSNLYLT